MTHTVESLLKLADGYVMTYPHGDYKAKRAALQSALTEVLAELASAKATIEYQSETWHSQDAYITSLQSKCESQAREIERLTESNKRNATFYDELVHKEQKLRAKVAAMEAQEPVAYLHPTLPKAISLPDLLEQPHHIQLDWTKGARLYLAPGAAPKAECVCGENTLGVVHRKNGPCFWPSDDHVSLAQAAPAAQKEQP